VLKLINTIVNINKNTLTKIFMKTMKITILCYETPCIPVGVQWCFRNVLPPSSGLKSSSYGGVRLSLVGTSTLFGLLYEPLVMDDDERGAIGGMIGKGNRSTRRKVGAMSLRPPQIPHDLTLDRTWAVAVGRRRLTGRVEYLAKEETKRCGEKRLTLLPWR
jgi:hypothetical protein